MGIFELSEVLKAKGFGEKWITWIEDILKSGQTCVMFNGEFGNYFNCKRGFKTGRPSFSLFIKFSNGCI